MRKYKIGDQVKKDILDDEGIVIAIDDREDEYAKVKVRFNNIFIGTEWVFESMLDKVIK